MNSLVGKSFESHELSGVIVVVVPSVLNKNMVGHKNIKAEAWEGLLKVIYSDARQKEYGQKEYDHSFTARLACVDALLTWTARPLHVVTDCFNKDSMDATFCPLFIACVCNNLVYKFCCNCSRTFIQIYWIQTFIWYQSTDLGDSGRLIFASATNTTIFSSSNPATMGDQMIPHVSDPLTLHHSDSPSLVLVSQLLDGHNYGQWSRSMRIALSAKNKLGFVDGSIKNPATTDAKYSIWQRCNDMVLSWIWQSVQGNIAHSILYCKTATAAWRDLED
ncbi:hypothetical protein TB1_014502 [Malus domestica]